MTAFFLAPIYIIVNIYIFMRITGWLKTGFPVLGTRRGIVLSAAVYSFFALSFLIAFLMPEGTAQRIMKLLGNYWLGVLLYMIFVIVVADIVRLVLLHILHIEREKLCNPKMRRIARTYLRRFDSGGLRLRSDKCRNCQNDSVRDYG